MDGWMDGGMDGCKCAYIHETLMKIKNNCNGFVFLTILCMPIKQNNLRNERKYNSSVLDTKNSYMDSIVSEAILFNSTFKISTELVAFVSVNQVSL
jgi:hypothetical protein